MDPTNSRITSLSKQLTVFTSKTKQLLLSINLLDKYRLLSTINPKEFRTAVYGKHVEERDRILMKMSEDVDFIPSHKLEMTRKEMREHSFKLLMKFHKIIKPTYEDFLKDSSKYNAYGDALFCFDMSVAARYGVNFYLYLRTLINFGNEKHQIFINNVFKGTDIGCFALTELGHGSNAKDILTTAKYDINSKKFILNTPSDLAMKFWVGNAADIANMSVVFAQLYLGEKCYGVHAFVVPLRDKNHDLFPGVVIGDCGMKLGLNGLDNGFIIFKNVAIPKEYLLDRFSKVSDQGDFSSNIANPEKRFGMQLISLSEGRIQICSRSITNLLNSVTIAARFCAVRRQFGVPEKQELPILEYPLVQIRLIKHVSSGIILKLATQRLYDLWYENTNLYMDHENPLTAEIHAIISILKPITTWASSQGIQECRELCGGFGYSEYNRLGFLKNDNDINTTWEGDNNVLSQQAARFLLECLRHVMKGKKLPYPSLEFLKVNFSEEKCIFKNKKELVKTENLIKIYEYKLNYILHDSLKILQNNLGKYPDIFDAWNNSQVFYLKNAAMTYGELFVLKESIKNIKKIAHKPTRKITKKLHDLWALCNLESSISQISEYFSKEQIVFIRESITEICKELKNETVGIIDAIACPDRILGSPIGAFDGNIYMRFLQSIYAAPGCFEKADYWKDIVRK